MYLPTRSGHRVAPAFMCRVEADGNSIFVENHSECVFDCPREAVTISGSETHEKSGRRRVDEESA